MRYRCAPSVVPCLVHKKGGIMPDLDDYYGVDVGEALNRYIHSEGFGAWLDATYPGDHPSISFVTLNNDFRSEWDWRNPLNPAHIQFSWVIWGDFDAAMAPDGTMQNIEGKLRFVLRENMNSVEAETMKYLVQAGDFPFQGAGTYKGFTGGVSGRSKREDWQIYCHLIDYLVDLMDQVATEASKACDVLRDKPNCPKGLKYMNVKAFKRGFDPEVSLREFFDDTPEGRDVISILVDKLGCQTFDQLYFWFLDGDVEGNPNFSDENKATIYGHINRAAFSFAA